MRFTGDAKKSDPEKEVVIGCHSNLDVNLHYDKQITRYSVIESAITHTNTIGVVHLTQHVFKIIDYF